MAYTITKSRLNTRQQFAPTPLLLLLLLMYCCQAIIPIGYMPASLADEGTLVKFCPKGLSDDVMAALHPGHHPSAESNDHTHHHHHGAHHAAMSTHDSSPNRDVSHDHESWQNFCPYGASTVADALVYPSFEFSVQPIGRLKTQPLTATEVIAELLRNHTARAPPTLTA